MQTTINPALFYPVLLYIAVLVVVGWWRLRGHACLLCGREIEPDEDRAELHVCQSHKGPLM